MPPTRPPGRRSELVLVGGGVRPEVLIVLLHPGDVRGCGRLGLLEVRVLGAGADQALRLVLRPPRPARKGPEKDAHTRLPRLCESGVRPPLPPRSFRAYARLGRPSSPEPG